MLLIIRDVVRHNQTFNQSTIRLLTILFTYRSKLGFKIEGWNWRDKCKTTNTAWPHLLSASLTPSLTIMDLNYLSTICLSIKLRPIHIKPRSLHIPQTQGSCLHQYHTRPSWVIPIQNNIVHFSVLTTCSSTMGLHKYFFAAFCVCFCDNLNYNPEMYIPVYKLFCEIMSICVI